MSGRLCQWAHWEGWVSGWSRGSSPVSAQSTSKASEGTTDTPIRPEISLKSLFLKTFFYFESSVHSRARTHVFVCVCAQKTGLNWSRQIAFIAVFLTVRMRKILWNCRAQVLLVCDIYISVAQVLDLHRGGAGSRSTVVLLGEFTGFPSNLASLFTDTSRFILKTRWPLEWIDLWQRSELSTHSVVAECSICEFQG